MPELPEVETIRSQLAQRLPGLRITHAEVVDPLLTHPEPPEAVEALLPGRVVTALDRRGKYLLIRLDDGDTLAVHLRMTGRLHWRDGEVPEGEERFLRAFLRFENGGTLTFGDQRRFGRMWLIPVHTDEARYWHGRVGPEPLDDRFTARVLGDRLRGRRVGIKAALLNQAVVAGVGNMYADEALFQAGIHPLHPAGELTAAQVARLHRAVRDRLRVAIAAGGASIDTYRDGMGNRGSMQDLLRVHLHRDDPCPRCGTTIIKTVVAQRGTYLCPSCQVAP